MKLNTSLFTHSINAIIKNSNNNRYVQDPGMYLRSFGVI